jgi:rubrerythrin
MTPDKHHESLNNLVDLFIDLESSLETYYDLCAKIFPDEKYAWYGIATQEGIHAKIFKKIKEHINEEPERWAAGKYNFEALKTMVNSVHEKLAAIKAKDYISQDVINFARDVESSLVEADMANAFVSESGEFRIVIKKILEETREHKEFMTRFLESR